MDDDISIISHVLSCNIIFFLINTYVFTLIMKRKKYYLSFVDKGLNEIDIGKCDRYVNTCIDEIVIKSVTGMLLKIS